jgi:hypothetical protein
MILMSEKMTSQNKLYEIKSVPYQTPLPSFYLPRKISQITINCNSHLKLLSLPSFIPSPTKFLAMSQNTSPLMMNEWRHWLAFPCCYLTIGGKVAPRGELFRSTIAKVTFDTSTKNYFQLELDAEPYIFYTTQYGPFILHADHDNVMFHQHFPPFLFHRITPGNPINQEAQSPPRNECQKIGGWMLDDDYSSDNEDNE